MLIFFDAWIDGEYWGAHGTWVIQSKCPAQIGKWKLRWAFRRNFGSCPRVALLLDRRDFVPRCWPFHNYWKGVVILCTSYGQWQSLANKKKKKKRNARPGKTEERKDVWLLEAGHLDTGQWLPIDAFLHKAFSQPPPDLASGIDPLGVTGMTKMSLLGSLKIEAQWTKDSSLAFHWNGNAPEMWVAIGGGINLLPLHVWT